MAKMDDIERNGNVISMDCHGEAMQERREEHNGDRCG